MLSVMRQVIWRRRVSVLWWGLGLIAVDGLLAIAYPTIRDNTELDRTFAGLPPSVQAVLALQHGSSLTSPIGYLNSQFFANVLPVMLLVFGIGVSAWAIAGDESAGTLELLLSNPVSRLRIAMERAGAVLALMGALVAIAAAGMAALAPPFGLNRGLGATSIVAAVLAVGCLAVTYGAVAFAVGAISGSRSAAIASASALAVAQFMVEGLAEPVRALRPFREVSPWHWLLASDPLTNGLTLRNWLLPLCVSVALVAVGTWGFGRRDLH
jgi:ABC-2 type transport system permease protein